MAKEIIDVLTFSSNVDSSEEIFNRLIEKLRLTVIPVNMLITIANVSSNKHIEQPAVTNIYYTSELYEAEFTCAGLFRKETKLAVGSARGSLLFYKWGEFGLHTDELPWSKKKAISCLIPISENIAVTGWEDGQIRATYLFPHKQLGVVGRHDLCIEALDISHDGAYIASSSIDQKLRFWPISFFEDPDLLVSLDRKSNQRNLPSSNVVDRSEFFADLA